VYEHETVPFRYDVTKRGHITQAFLEKHEVLRTAQLHRFLEPPRAALVGSPGEGDPPVEAWVDYEDGIPFVLPTPAPEAAVGDCNLICFLVASKDSEVQRKTHAMVREVTKMTTTKCRAWSLAALVEDGIVDLVIDEVLATVELSGSYVVPAAYRVSMSPKSRMCWTCLTTYLNGADACTLEAGAGGDCSGGGVDRGRWRHCTGCPFGSA